MDAFLSEKLEKILPNKNINILDIGCGSGYIRKIFTEIGYNIDYTGLDVKKHIDFDKLNGKFVNSKIEDFQTALRFYLWCPYQ